MGQRWKRRAMRAERPARALCCAVLILLIGGLPALGSPTAQDFEAWPEVAPWGDSTSPDGWRINDGAVTGTGSSFARPLDQRCGWLRDAEPRQPGDFPRIALHGLAAGDHLHDKVLSVAGDTAKAEPQLGGLSVGQGDLQQAVFQAERDVRAL